MDGKRVRALALTLIFVAACGGATPSTSGAGGATAATGAAAATTGTTSGTGTPGGGTTASPGAVGPKLTDVLSASKNATYKITYKITAGGAAAGFSGDQTWYFKPPRSRFDFSIQQGGQALTMSFFTLPEGTYYCMNIGQTQCFGVAGVGSPLDQNAAAVAQRSLITNPSGYGATFTGAKTIAGQSASCYDVSANAASTFTSGTFCYTTDGVPMLSTFTAAGATWSMEATNYSTTVPDSDFTLPAKPTTP